MHGIIFQQLQQFVTKNYGVQQWLSLLDSIQLKGKVYLPTQVYPDQEAISIVAKASEVTNISVTDILESFGEFIAPSLLRIYSASIRPEWSTIDLLEHVENTIHKAVRFADKSATPPQLACERLSRNVVMIDYSSNRKMIEVGIGIIKAIARAKNETVDIVRADAAGVTTLKVSLKTAKPVASL